MQNKAAKGILASIRYATLSTVDLDGQPWAAPVWYAYSNGKLFWWSAQDSQHQKNIAHNGQVFITIFDSHAKEGDGTALYIKATVKVVGTDQLQQAIYAFNATTSRFTLTTQNCSGDAPTRLYEATPVAVWLNDGKEVNSFWQDYRREITLN